MSKDSLPLPVNEATDVVLVDEEARVSGGRILDETDLNGQPTGLKLYYPDDDEKRALENLIGDELDEMEKEHEPLWNKAVANIRTYEALPDGDKEDMLMLPFGKRDTNHLWAFFVNRIWNKKPFATIEPEEFGYYEVPIPMGQGPMGETISRTELRSAEELAEAGERLIEHYVRRRLPMRKFLYTTIGDCVMGAGPVYGETCYKRTMKPELVPNFKRLPGGMVVVDGYIERERVSGSPHKLIAHPTFNCMMSHPALDIQEAETFAVHNPESILHFRHKILENEYYLATEDDFEDCKKAANDLRRYEQKTDLAEMKDRKVDRPKRQMDVWNVWRYYPVVLQNDMGEEEEGVLSLVIPFERTTRKILGMALNGYAHGKRPFVSYVQRPRPHQIGGYSTGEDVMPTVKYQTRMYHSQLQNAYLANQIIVGYRPGSPSAEWLKRNQLGYRSKIPRQAGGDLEPMSFGRDLRSLAPEIGALDALQRQIGVSDAVRGATIPGRTSRAAISLVQEAGLTVPMLDLDHFRECLSEQITMLYQNIGQWSIYGEEIPWQNPETRAITMKAVEFPLEGVGRFNVRITASSDEETAQFEFERDIALSRIQAQAHAERARILGPVFDERATPAIISVQRQTLIAHELLMARVFELARLDPKKYTLDERQIDELIEMQRQAIAQRQQMMMQQMMAMQGGQLGGNVVPIRGAGGGGGVSNAGAPSVPGTTYGMVASPGLATPGGAP